MLEQKVKKFLEILKPFIKKIQILWKKVAEKSRLFFGKIGKWLESKLQTDGEPWGYCLANNQTSFEYPVRPFVSGIFIWCRDCDWLCLKFI